MSKIITIFGATGNQGGSVINSILHDPVLSKEFKIRGVTRDVTKASAKLLEVQGVEMVQATLDSKAGVAEAIKDSHTVFLVTNYWETGIPGIEFLQGKNVTDAAKETKVSHLIFSSLPNVSEISKGRLTHVHPFDGKAEIERYIRESGLPCTFFMAGYFMSNYSMLLRKGDDGVYVLAYPVSDRAKFPLLAAAEDTGKFVKSIIKNREKLLDKQVFGATDYYTPSQIVVEFTEVTGNRAVFVPVTPEQYIAALPPPVAQVLLESHLLVEEPGYFSGTGLVESLNLLEEKPTTWKEFLLNSEGFK